MEKITIIEMPEESSIYGDVTPYSKEGFALFRKWCSDNGVTYYGEDKMKFSEAEGRKKAKLEGNSKLLMERY